MSALWGVRAKHVLARASLSAPLDRVHWTSPTVPVTSLLAAAGADDELPRVPFGGGDAASDDAWVGVPGAARTTVVLVHGASGSGATALSAELGAVFGGSRVFVLSPDRLLPMSEPRQAEALRRVFSEARRYGTAAIVLDDLTGILQAVGGDQGQVTCSRLLLHTLRSLLKTPLPVAHQTSAAPAATAHVDGVSARPTCPCFHAN